jgi:hypothetical protein
LQISSGARSAKSNDRAQIARYGGPLFREATSLRLKGGLGRPRQLFALVASATRRPAQLVALFRLLLLTPAEVVQLSSAETGLALRQYFDQRFLGILPQNRLCRGVLLIPADHRAYLRGRRRQALRTNLRRAATNGVWCELLSDRAQALAAVEEVLPARRKAPDDLATLRATWRQIFAQPELTVFVARGPRGSALAVIAAVIDCDVCLIRIAIASNYDARWALHDHLARELSGRGVRYLLAEGDGPFGALGFDRELHHYQHLLGYELRHLVPARTRRRRRS